MFPTTGISGAILFDELQGLMELPGVIPELGHDESRPGGDLFLQFEILDHLFRFGRLEGGNGHSGEKITRLMLDGPLEARVFQPLIHPLDQLDGLHRVEVEDRFGPSLKTGHGIIPAHDQEVPHSRPIEGVEFAFELVSVLVLAGKMDKGFYPQPQDLLAQIIGEDGRVSPGIVRDRQGMNLLPLRRLLGGGQGLLLVLLPRPPSRDEFPCDRQGRRIQQ